MVPFGFDRPGVPGPPFFAYFLKIDGMAFVTEQKKQQFTKTKTQPPEIQAIALDVAEEERFELPVPFSTTVFKTAPLNHSGTPPKGRFFSRGKGKISFYIFTSICVQFNHLRDFIFPLHFFKKTAQVTDHVLRGCMIQVFGLADGIKGRFCGFQGIERPL